MLLCLCALLPFATSAVAQPTEAVKWQFEVAPKSDMEVEVRITATMDEGWHIYSQLTEEGGPKPTTFTFSPSESYELIGKVKEESTPIEKLDPTFMMPVWWFDNTAVFSQRLKLHTTTAAVNVKIEFMACTDYECLLPEEVPFEIPVTLEK